MSLEVDARSHGVPTTFPQRYEGDKVFHNKASSGMPPPSSSQGKHNSEIRKIFPYMIITLIVMTTLAAVSAGLAGSYAKKQIQAVKECSKAMHSMSVLDQSPVSSTVLGAAAQSVQPTTSETSPLPTPSANPSVTEDSISLASTSQASTSPASISLASTSLIETALPTGSLLVPSFQSIDECSELDDTKSFPQGTEDRPVKFRIKCKIDRPSAYSLLQVYVYTFEDCVKACASYNYNASLHKNSICAGVTYGTARSRNIGGNCFFMSDLNADTVEDDKVNTALYLSHE